MAPQMRQDIDDAYFLTHICESLYMSYYYAIEQSSFNKHHWNRGESNENLCQPEK